jgi:hypothetical protein
MNSTRDLELVLEPLTEGLEKSAGRESGVLQTAFGKKNRIMLGAPVLRALEPAEFGLTAQDVADRQLEGFRLAAVATTVSFLPDFGCRFIAADLSVAFSTGPDAAPPPTVVDLRPREIVREEDYTSEDNATAKLSGSVSPGFAKLLGEVSKSSRVQTGGKTMVRDLYAFGLDGPEAGWRFQASRGHDLAGIYEGLVFAVRLPAQARLYGEVRLGAEIAVEAALDRWATLAFGLAGRRTASEVQFELG